MKRIDFTIFAFISIVAVVTLGNLVFNLHKSSPKNEEAASIVEKRPAPKAASRISRNDFDRPSPLATIEETGNKEKIDAQVLIAKLGDPDIDISLQAADKLAELGSQASAQLVKELQTADLRLKGQIIFILGRIGDKEAVPALIVFLNDDNAYIRRNAAEALGKIKDSGCVYELSRTLLDQDAGIRERSAWALGEIKDSRAVEGLIASLKTEKEECAKSAMVIALGKIKEVRAIVTLFDELNSQFGNLYRNKVVMALAEINDAQAINPLTIYAAELKSRRPDKPEYIREWEEAINLAEESIAKLRRGEG